MGWGGIEKVRPAWWAERSHPGKPSEGLPCGASVMSPKICSDSMGIFQGKQTCLNSYANEHTPIC